MTKGFATIATGDKRYYRMSYNLFPSYYFFDNNNMPFAIVCDSKNEHTEALDNYTRRRFLTIRNCRLK